jgi:hypothetical protein
MTATGMWHVWYTPLLARQLVAPAPDLRVMRRAPDDMGPAACDGTIDANTVYALGRSMVESEPLRRQPTVDLSG